MKDYYYILGIVRTATVEQIKSAYRKLSIKFHPDKNNGDKFFEDRFKEIQEAYDTLSNPDSKKRYDANLNNRSSDNNKQSNDRSYEESLKKDFDEELEKRRKEYEEQLKRKEKEHLEQLRKTEDEIKRRYQTPEQRVAEEAEVRRRKEEFERTQEHNRNLKELESLKKKLTERNTELDNINKSIIVKEAEISQIKNDIENITLKLNGQKKGSVSKRALWTLVIIILLICVLVVAIWYDPSGIRMDKTNLQKDNSTVTSDSTKDTKSNLSASSPNDQNQILIKMAYVKGGTFQMGSSSGDKDEDPIHGVTVNDFYISTCEITLGQWRQIIDEDKGNYLSEYPMENVSWNNVQAFISKLNMRNGKKYRLPTEAEWEYAARGGIQSNNYVYSGSNNINDVAWYQGNSSEIAHIVHQKNGNELGIYDMTGNVWEWCSDWYDVAYYNQSESLNPHGPQYGTGKVLRGGSWKYDARHCRCSSRNFAKPDEHNKNIGFRLVLDANLE